MGAPLGVEDSTWISSAADDVANDRANHREEVDEPFLAGLDLHGPSKSKAHAEQGSSVLVHIVSRQIFLADGYYSGSQDADLNEHSVITIEPISQAGSSQLQV